MRRVVLLAVIANLVVVALFVPLVYFVDQFLADHPDVRAPQAMSLFDPLQVPRMLLWPSLAAGRLGARQTWCVTLGVLVALFLMARRCVREQRPWLAALPLLGYVCVAWAYIYVLPIPKPAFSEFDLIQKDREQHRAFLATYEEAYRWGMIDTFVNVDGDFGPGTRAGWLRGFSAGVAEWESILPGVTDSKMRYITRSPPGVRPSRSLHARIEVTLWNPRGSFRPRCARLPRYCSRSAPFRFV